MACRCWCHGIRHHPNGDLREDITVPEHNMKKNEYLAHLREGFAEEDRRGQTT
jgi:hypothetical protein